MKLNSNVALTLILLALMFGAGMVSAAYGFALGREALKGITQPDVRPINNLSGRKGTLPRREEVMLLKENDIIKSVEAQIDGNTKNPTSQENRSKFISTTTTPSKPGPADTKPQAGFPVTSSDRGVTLEVRSARQQGGSLLLNINLRNDGDRAIKFLYSFLNVTDDQGRVLSASTEGLPAELPPRSETFSGTVSISTVLLDNATKLSLALTDYPDQQLQLQVAGIPVVR